MELEKHLKRENEMCFDTSVIYKAIKEKTIETPAKTLAAMSDDSEQDISSKNDKRETFLHLIAQMFERDSDSPYLIPVVFQLSNAGLDVNSVDSDGNTALHIAAKSTGSRKLIRTLLMVGCDPNVKNVNKQTAAMLAKHIPDNVKILEKMSPDLWEAVARRNKANVAVALSFWYKVTQKRHGETLLERAEKIGYGDVISMLRAKKMAIEFVHFCLAGDRQKLRPFFRQPVNLNATSPTFIDAISGIFLSMPIIGEVALLGLESVVRKLVRKSADLYLVVKNEPVYLYIIKNILPQKQLYTVVDTIAAKLDFKSRSRREITTVLNAAYLKRIPMDVLRTMATSGLDIFAVDKHGHFLRDRILIKNIGKNPKQIAEELTYVDNIPVDMASFGATEVLKRLTQKNYEHIDVTNQDKLTSRQALEQLKGDHAAKEFFEEERAILKRHRQLCRVIEIGHLAQFQNLVTLQVAMVTDKRGRTLLHRAILFERRHIVRKLIKVYPEHAKTADYCGRTPLHWACLLTEDGEIEDILQGMRCKMDAEDENGETPSDFKSFSASKKKSMLEDERELDPGLDIYLYYRYMEIKETIRTGDLVQLDYIRGGMYQDIPLDDLQKRMYQTDPPALDLLQMAIDARRDLIIKFLLTCGMSWDVKVKDGKEEVSLLEVAKRKELRAVETYINYQLQQEEEKAELISKLKNKGKIKK